MVRFLEDSPGSQNCVCISDGKVLVFPGSQCIPVSLGPLGLTRQQAFIYFKLMSLFVECFFISSYIQTFVDKT